MSKRIRYVGLDVSKETIAVAVAEPDGSVVGYGEIANNPGTVRRLVDTLSRNAAIKTAYEAGPLGIGRACAHFQLEPQGPVHLTACRRSPWSLGRMKRIQSRAAVGAAGLEPTTSWSQSMGV
jgi:hypothetical protein